MEFNRKFPVNGARPVGFLTSELGSDTRLEVLKLSFANVHEDFDKMNSFAVLPKSRWCCVRS